MKYLNGEHFKKMNQKYNGNTLYPYLIIRMLINRYVYLMPPFLSNFGFFTCQKTWSVNRKMHRLYS